MQFSHRLSHASLCMYTNKWNWCSKLVFPLLIYHIIHFLPSQKLLVVRMKYFGNLQEKKQNYTTQVFNSSIWPSIYYFFKLWKGIANMSNIFLILVMLFEKNKWVFDLKLLVFISAFYYWVLRLSYTKKQWLGFS